MDEWLDGLLLPFGGWIDGWMVGWMDGWVGGCVGGVDRWSFSSLSTFGQVLGVRMGSPYPVTTTDFRWMNGRMGGWTQIDGWMGGWMHGRRNQLVGACWWMNGWMNGWMNE